MSQIRYEPLKPRYKSLRANAAVFMSGNKLDRKNI